MSDHTPDLERYRKLGQRLTSLTVGMDRLERRVNRGAGALDDEGLIPIYLGGDLVPEATLESWEAVFAQLEKLQSEAQAYPTGSRRVFLIAMID